MNFNLLIARCLVCLFTLLASRLEVAPLVTPSWYCVTHSSGYSSRYTTQVVFYGCWGIHTHLSCLDHASELCLTCQKMVLLIDFSNVSLGRVEVDLQFSALLLLSCVLVFSFLVFSARCFLMSHQYGAHNASCISRDCHTSYNWANPCI